MLNVFRKIPKIRDRKDRFTDHVFIMYERAVLRFVRIALGAETNYGCVLLIRDNADDAVRRDRLFIEHERDGLTGLNGKRVNLFDIDQ